MKGAWRSLLLPTLIPPPSADPQRSKDGPPQSFPPPPQPPGSPLSRQNKALSTWKRTHQCLVSPRIYQCRLGRIWPFTKPTMALLTQSLLSTLFSTARGKGHQNRLWASWRQRLLMLAFGYFCRQSISRGRGLYTRIPKYPPRLRCP